MISFGKHDPDHLFGIDEEWWNTEGIPGISFVIRCRGFEKTLELAIRSLMACSVPHEILVLFNGLPEGSEPPALPADLPVTCFTYTPKIARPGVEHLLTPPDSVHSFVWFSNWCLNKTKYSYIFRYDADFIASRFLLDQLTEVLASPPTAYRIKAAFADTLKVNEEAYLIPRLARPRFISYHFWEYMNMLSPVPEGRLTGSILHDSSLTSPKPYFREPAWWVGTEDGDALERKCQHIVDRIGIRYARASDPETDLGFYKYMALLAEDTAKAEPSANNYLNLSLTHYQAGEYRECVAAAQAAINLKPDYAEAWNNLCAAQNELGNYAEGIKAGEQALRLQPGSSHAQANLAWARRELGR